jgi:hypothetical protein
MHDAILPYSYIICTSSRPRSRVPGWRRAADWSTRCRDGTSFTFPDARSPEECSGKWLPTTSRNPAHSRRRLHALANGAERPQVATVRERAEPRQLPGHAADTGPTGRELRPTRDAGKLPPFHRTVSRGYCAALRCCLLRLERAARTTREPALLRNGSRTCREQGASLQALVPRNAGWATGVPRPQKAARTSRG